MKTLRSASIASYSSWVKVEVAITRGWSGPTGDAESTGLPVEIAVSGPWQAPKIYPDVEGIFDDPEAAYEALRGLGVSGKTMKKIGKKGKKLLEDLFGN